eukprot:2008023-Prymnesium_polylepis.1
MKLNSNAHTRTQTHTQASERTAHDQRTTLALRGSHGWLGTHQADVLHTDQGRGRSIADKR